MPIRVIVLVLAALWSVPVSAQNQDQIDTLYDAVGMPEILAVMRDEGLAYGDELEDQLFPGRGGAAWTALVDRIYNHEAMDQGFRAEFARAIAGTNLVPLIDFFSSERGRQITALEIGARRALLDDSIEEAARMALADMEGEIDPRLDLIRAFVEANDLVESNVMGAMNANYAFYVGMIEGNAFPVEMTEQQILDDVWSQEIEIRVDTTEWVYSYLVMAYQPLSDADIVAYTALSETAEGRALNRALFAAFDEMFIGISKSLGLAASRFVAGEDI